MAKIYISKLQQDKAFQAWDKVFRSNPDFKKEQMNALNEYLNTRLSERLKEKLDNPNNQ